MTDTHQHPAIAPFLAWATRDRNRSPETLKRYRRVLEDLATYGNPLTIGTEAVEQWWASRYDHSPATRKNDLFCLRAYYRWATRFDHRPDDPTRRLDPPKQPTRLPHPIGETDLKRLFVATEDTPDLRRAIALGAYAGLRIAEAAGLDWANIDQEARRIYITGKGSKERAFALSPLLLDRLLPDTGGNVVTAGGPPYSPGTLQRKVNRLMTRAGVAHTFHDLRKRGATLAIAQTGDIYTVAKAFGWSSIETASSYALVSDEALDRIANAVV